MSAGTSAVAVCALRKMRHLLYHGGPGRVSGESCEVENEWELGVAGWTGGG